MGSRTRDETGVWNLSGARWRLGLRGDGMTRVVCLNGSGHVLSDREVAGSDTAVDLPHDTVRLVLGGHAEARETATAPAVAGTRMAAGWQAHSRLLQLAPSTLLAAGAIVLLPAEWSAGLHATVGAAELARVLPGIATQLPANGTLVVQLDRRVEAASLAAVAVKARGMTLTAPQPVDSGDRVSLVYGIDGAGAPDGRGTVSVAATGDWTPAGVVSVPGAPTDWIAALTRSPRLTLVADTLPGTPTAIAVSLTPKEVA